MAIKHAKTSGKSDGGDASLVLPSDWNADHSGISLVRKTADESVTSSTTLQNDDALLFAIASSEVWVVEFVLFVVGNTSGDVKLAVTVPASASVYYGIVANSIPGSGYVAGSSNSATATSGDEKSADVMTSPGVVLVIKGYVANSTTAGNVTLQWAQAASSGTATTVKAGSHLIAHKVA